MSQRMRDLSDRFKGLGELLEGAPRLLDVALVGSFVAGTVYLLRPALHFYKTPPPTPTEIEYHVKSGGVIFRGQNVGVLEIRYPDRIYAQYVAIAVAVIAAGGHGDIGTVLAPLGYGLAFNSFIEHLFPGAPIGDDVWAPWELAAGRLGADAFETPGYPADYGKEPDVTWTVYTKILLPKYLKALLVAAVFYWILRYVRTTGAA